MSSKTKVRGKLPSPEFRLRLESSVFENEALSSGTQLLLEEEREKKKKDEEVDDSMLKSIDIDHDEAIINELNTNIDQNIRDLEDLNEIAKDLQVELASQKEDLDVVEGNLTSADQDTMGAVVELGESRKIQSSTRTTKSMLAGAGSCALTFGVAGAVLGPPGSATGALVGAVVGAALGAGVGAGLGFGVGKAMDETRVVEKEQIDLCNQRIFLPFEGIPQCMNCHVTFSLFHHPHHCRLCGCVCCSACLREERVAYPNVQEAVKCRVCVECLRANALREVGSEHPCKAHHIGAT